MGSGTSSRRASGWDAKLASTYGRSTELLNGHIAGPPLIPNDRRPSALYTGIGTVNRSTKVNRDDFEATRRHHRFQQPPKGAVLVSDVFSEIPACNPGPGRR